MDGEGIEPLFRHLARKLVEQKRKRDVQLTQDSQTPAIGSDSGSVDYFNGPHATGSFRLGKASTSITEFLQLVSNIC